MRTAGSTLKIEIGDSGRVMSADDESVFVQLYNMMRELEPLLDEYRAGMAEFKAFRQRHMRGALQA